MDKAGMGLFGLGWRERLGLAAALIAFAWLLLLAVTG
jgi:hypothetical protein